MTFQPDLDAIRDAMAEPEDTAELQIERKCDWIIRQLDELCALAANVETVDLIEAQRPAIGHIVMRSQLAANLLMAKHPSKLRLVRNA